MLQSALKTLDLGFNGVPGTPHSEVLFHRQYRFFDEVPEAGNGESWGANHWSSAQLASKSLSTRTRSVALDLPPWLPFFVRFMEHDLVASNSGLWVHHNHSVAGKRHHCHCQESSNTLDLQCIYGMSGGQCDCLLCIQSLIRNVAEPGKLRLSVSQRDFGETGVRLRADLLRLRALTAEEMQSLESDADCCPMWSAFIKNRYSIASHESATKAVIADYRNDGDFILSQFHTLWIKFHNRLCDFYSQKYKSESSDSIYRRAKRDVVFHYQWLVVNEVLPALCREGSIPRPFDSAFYDIYARKVKAGESIPAVPLEFSVAIRFYRSMFHSCYRVNADVVDATWVDDFRNWQSDRMVSSDGRILSGRWLDIDWKLFSGARNSNRLHVAPIGVTHWFQQLQRNQPKGLQIMFRELMHARHIRAPTAQECIAGFFINAGVHIDALEYGELTDGPLGQFIANAGYVSSTPLWIYLQQEASVREEGRRLGPLGAELISQTVLGSLTKDSDSYWNAGTGACDQWHPTDCEATQSSPVLSVHSLFEKVGD